LKGERGQIAITDFRLFFPESWAEDAARCVKAKVPVNHRRPEPKWQQALAMIQRAKEQGLRYGWVGMNSLYGSNAQLLNELEDRGESSC